MTNSYRVDPPTFAVSAVGLGLTLAAIFGTAVPVVREAETVVVRPHYVPTVFTPSAVDANVSESVNAHSASALGAELLSELRSLTSFTWEQTSKLLGVSRRTIHLWAAGGNMSAGNEERLASLIQEARALQRSGGGQNRVQLLALLDRERASHASSAEDINRPAPTYLADS